MLVLDTVSSFNIHGTNTIAILLPALVESDVSRSLSAIHDLCNLYAIQIN